MGKTPGISHTGVINAQNVFSCILLITKDLFIKNVLLSSKMFSGAT